MTSYDFLKRIEEKKLKILDLALALLWWVGRDDPSKGMTATEICVETEYIPVSF
jgi:hypothetical protein